MRIMLWVNRRAILAIFLLVFTLPSFAQSQKPLSLDDISNLLKNGVTPNRVAQLIGERGVGFELDDQGLRRLKQDGANDTVLAAVKTMSARYTDARQQARREQEDAAQRKREEQAKRKDDDRRKAAEPKNQQANVPRQSPIKTETKTKGPAEPVQRPPGPILRTPEDAGRIATLRNLMTTEQGEVSGEVVNLTKQTLREVRLQIVYSWRWNDEYNPGKNDPGRAIDHTLEQEIPPGQAGRFSYSPTPPLASRQDGQFEISVKIAGFAQVFTGVPQK